MGHCSPMPSDAISTISVPECQAWGMETSYGNWASVDVRSLIVVVDCYTNSIPVLQPILFDLKSKYVSFQAQLLKLDAGVGS